MNLLNIRIEIYSIIRDLIKNIWVIFLAMLMGFMSIYIATRTFYTPEYTASALLVVNAKSSTTGTYSLFSRSIEMTKVVSRVIIDKSIMTRSVKNFNLILQIVYFSTLSAFLMISSLIFASLPTLSRM